MLDGIFAPVASGSRVCVSEKPDVVVNIPIIVCSLRSSSSKSLRDNSADYFFLSRSDTQKHQKTRSHDSSLMIKAQSPMYKEAELFMR